MKKYSRSANTRKNKTHYGSNYQNQCNIPQVDILVRGLDRCSLGGGGGDQQSINKIPRQKHATETQEQHRHKHERMDDTMSSPFYDSADFYSLIGPGALQSLSDSTQCDIASLDYTDIGQPISLPLNCVWGNGMQFQPTISMQTTPCPRYTTTSATPTIPLPLVTLPSQNFNPHLPFPDKSGSVNLLSYGLQGSVTQPPAPTLNASLGYPTVYVSPAGLITILLKYDIAIEMTVDKNIRVVNHRHKAVAASNNRGSINCIYHVAAKAYQDGTKVEIEVFGERRARMQTEGILFASTSEVYLLDDKHIVPSQFVFNNMSKDSSVNVLFAQGQNFTNDLLIQCDSVTKSSKYYFHKDGSTTIIINGVKITQDEKGEVSVISGPRFISTSPIYGNIYLQTHFVEMSVQVNWNVSIQRGNHRVCSTYTNFVVCNGKHEAGFNQLREVFSRDYNPTVSDFENWLPSLTFLCQGLPQYRKLRPANYKQSSKQQSRNQAAGDQPSPEAPRITHKSSGRT